MEIPPKQSLSSNTTTSNTVTKETNPYNVPTVTVKLGQKGVRVKWLQWELNQSGANLEVDGSFGNATLEALKKFQSSHNLEVDGLCGPATRKALLAE